MNRTKPILALFAAALLAPAFLAACEKGPAEKAGKNIDKAAEKTGDKMKEAGDKLKDATK